MPTFEAAAPFTFPIPSTSQVYSGAFFSTFSVLDDVVYVTDDLSAPLGPIHAPITPKPMNNAIAPRQPVLNFPIVKPPIT